MECMTLDESCSLLSLHFVHLEMKGLCLCCPRSFAKTALFLLVRNMQCVFVPSEELTLFGIFAITPIDYTNFNVQRHNCKVESVLRTQT